MWDRIWVLKNISWRWDEDKDYIEWDKKMDIHEEDKDHLINAHASAMEVVESHPDWIKIDCEIAWEMRSIEDINGELLEHIV